MADLSRFAITPRNQRRASFDEIRLAARGRWLEILTEIIGGESLTGKHAACPGCGGHDRFQFNRRSEAGAYSCRAHPDGGGDGFSLVMHVMGCDFKAAAKLVAEAVGLADGRGEHQPLPRLTPPPAPAVIDWTKVREKAARVWHESRQITGQDAAGLYLLRRGLAVPADADALRFHPALAYWTQDDTGQPEFIGRIPAIVALITGRNGDMSGLHRIYLDQEGRKFAVDGLPSKKMMKAGEMTGCAVRLGKMTGDRLAIAEGIETALAFSRLTGVCAWAALSASLLPSVWLPESARRIYIAHDADEAGERAAHRLAERLLADGRAVWLNAPPEGNDWNDYLLTMREVRHVA